MAGPIAAITLAAEAGTITGCPVFHYQRSLLATPFRLNFHTPRLRLRHVVSGFRRWNDSKDQAGASTMNAARRRLHSFLS